MSKSKKIFVCNNCGYQNLKWVGKCPDCGHWNSFEEVEAPSSLKKPERHFSIEEPFLLTEISSGEGKRIKTGIIELDRVLGGGIIPASTILIAGDPGIGKSTLLLQMADSLVRQKISILYVSGEESLCQIRDRADRLGCGNLTLPVLAETELENILHQIQKFQPAVVIIDSIQAIFSVDVAGAPGNIAQIRECTSQLFRLAKKEGWTLFLVGHITKEGGIAGPKLLEHMVDVVIYFEGDNLYQYRILRSLKNRYGAVNEIGLFLMESNGLKEVRNPSHLFISNRQDNPIGSGVVCCFEGTRPILAEVQSLVSRSNYGVPQRTVSGFDHRRLALILAILEKHCGLNFGLSDVFVKIAGGLRVDDPGIDLGIAAALYSSMRGMVLPPLSIYIGELGLNGEIRPVFRLEHRIQEAIKLGFKNIFIPKTKDGQLKIKLPPGFQLHEVQHISEIFQ